jgi:hypothetical protein
MDIVAVEEIKIDPNRSLPVLKLMESDSSNLEEYALTVPDLARFVQVAKVQIYSQLGP